MRMLPYIIALMCLFQVSFFAQESAQVTLTIRLYPIQTIEVAPETSQIVEISSENLTNPIPSSQLSRFSTSNHTTYVYSVKDKGFEALRAVRDFPPHIDKSINHIFSDENYYYKEGEEEEENLNVVYCIETM